MLYAHLWPLNAILTHLFYCLSDQRKQESVSTRQPRSFCNRSLIHTTVAQMMKLMCSLCWFKGSRDSLLVRVLDLWSSLLVWIPADAAGEFSPPVNFVCWLLVLVLFSVHFIPDTAVARKYPGHSAKSAGGRLHLNTHTPLTQQSWSGMTMPLSRHSVGTYQKLS